MPADYVRRTYGVTYKRGDRVTVDGRPGVIVSFPGQYLGVRFDGERHTSRAHPTWRVAAVPTSDGTDRYDDHCPTCDAPEPTHTATCAVVHVQVPEPGGSEPGGAS